MSLDSWLAFVLASLVLTMTPGPSILIGVVHSLNHGPHRALFTALGDISANCIQMILVAVGLGVVIASSELAFQVIKWLGVITLLYMGLKMLLAKPTAPSLKEGIKRASPQALFTSGFLVAAGNPKAIVFFTAFFPQFIDPNKPLFNQMLIMCPTMAVLDFTWVMIYALTANRFLKTMKKYPGLINKMGGSAMVGASGVLAWSSNTAR